MKRAIANNAWIMLAAGLLFSGCAGRAASPSPGGAQQAPPSLQQAPSIGTFYEKPLPSEGSLWNASGNMIFEDKKAKKVGDTVVVDIVENTSSQIAANTTADKESTLEAGIPNLLGYQQPFKLTNSKTVADPLFKAGFNNEFEGKGSSDRTGKITASIGGRVVEVLPNGNLVIYGRREMKVSNESQIITVYGIARPEDVNANNRVQSTVLADAKIAYYGQGVLADKQKPGWGLKILDRVWPF